MYKTFLKESNLQVVQDNGDYFVIFQDERYQATPDGDSPKDLALSIAARVKTIKDIERYIKSGDLKLIGEGYTKANNTHGLSWDYEKGYLIIYGERTGKPIYKEKVKNDDINKELEKFKEKRGY